MDYKHLTAERKELIDKRVGILIEKYTKDSSINWEQIAVDNSIIYLQDNRFLVGIAGRTSGGNYVVGVENNANTKDGRLTRGHEFCHQLLGHTRSDIEDPAQEDEANYFAEQITGTSNTGCSSWINAFTIVCKHPKRAYISAFGTSEEFKKYNNKILETLVPDLD